MEERVRGWENSEKSPKGEGCFWNVLRHRGGNGHERELGGCGDWVTGSPGEPECEDLGFLCRRRSDTSRSQAGEGLCSLPLGPAKGAQLWWKAEGPGWARDMDVTGLGQARDTLGGRGQGAGQLEVGRRETGDSGMTAVCLVPSDR